MEKMEDTEVYGQILKKDKEALEQLYDKYEKLLFSFALKMVRSPESAEEVVQEVMMKLWRGSGGIYDEEKGKFSSWILTMTRNTSIDYLRKQNRRQEEEVHQEMELQDTQAPVEEIVEWKQQRERIKEAMTSLKQEQQHVIEMFYFKGYSQKMIADKINIPLGTVKGRIRLALKHLKSELAMERGDWQ
ncbi:RNA polymerase sigma factor [Alkalicoccus daliensis]|uniref:RNA polymerase sigma-70 factor, ECF subfamily n=1 Tax=Alkalicoccus daliensis TaxID=745820 RepID=A0A1H0KHN9_9BACI|nr:sigma-70 family RNA polymerase sigma factor [Alkalicoccus daliensis]SDO55498.1 RNA polymerase sigma-70 factor, ECF subfamily [Alkalicoccus daliensis]